MPRAAQRRKFSKLHQKAVTKSAVENEDEVSELRPQQMTKKEKLLMKKVEFISSTRMIFACNQRIGANK